MHVETLWSNVHLITLDGEGRWMSPGLIDCHTHLVYAGNRANEFEQRLQGVSYADIARAGGGIVSTVRATRAATPEQLARESRPPVRHRAGCSAVRHGSSPPARSHALPRRPAVPAPGKTRCSRRTHPPLRPGLRQQWPECIAPEFITHHTQSTLRTAMVGFVTGKDPCTARDPFGQFHGTLSGFGSAVGKVYAIE